MPSTFRPALHIPAMLSSDPFGFASGVILPVGGRIPEDDPLVALQFRERCLIAKVIAFHVPDGNGQNFTLAVGSHAQDVGLKYICKPVQVRVESTDTMFTTHAARVKF